LDVADQHARDRIDQRADEHAGVEHGTQQRAGDDARHVADAREPALGPAMFLHRPSGANNPDAPISHHWQDASHITWGVITGGYGGVMEAALKGAAACEGKCIGVTTAFYKNFEKNQYVQREIRTNSYNDYLMQILDLSNAYILLPGSIGTLFEFSAIWALSQSGAIKRKPAVCVGEQWREIAETMAFYSPDAQKNMQIFSFVESPQEAVSLIQTCLEHDGKKL
ncbi:MAG: LOG family protein, partial [Bacteroidota bacterium]